MKAVVCTKYGSADVLKLVELEKPVPAPDEVLIRIHATSVSVADFRVRSFSVPLSFWIPGRLALGITKPKTKVLGMELSGTVGTYAIQLAKHFGAVVTAVCSGRNEELVRSLGADRVTDYTNEDFAEQGRMYDAVFDVVGKASYSGCVPVLKKGGTFLHAVGVPSVSLRMKWTSFVTGKKTVADGPKVNRADLEYLATLIDKGTIKPVIDRRYPLEQIADAHRYVETGRKRGNVVVMVQGTDNGSGHGSAAAG